MRSVTVKRGVWIACIVVVILVIAFAALPMIASTQIVRDRIAQELSSLTGYRVILAQGPELSVWPNVTANLGSVSLKAWGESEAPSVFEAERVDVELSAVAALSGRIVFSRIELVRPLLRLQSTGALLYPPSPTSSGRIQYAIDRARREIAASAVSPDLANLPDDPFGILEFVDGRIFALEDGAQREIMTSIAGRVDWPAFNRPTSVGATGVWRGEPVSLSLNAPQPLVLMAGGQTRINAAFKSTPIEASFEGAAGFARDGFFDGALRISSPSMRRLFEWSQSRMPFGGAVGAVTAASRVTGTRARLKFENAELTVDGNRGTGALEISAAETVPLLAGTLAFGELDLGSLLSAVAPLQSSDSAPPPVSGGIGATVEIDIRLSAAQARLAKIPLANVAASARIKNGLTTLDISDASAFGGSLQAGIRIDREWRANQVELRLSANDVDTAEIAASAGVTGPIPRAKGAMSLIVKGVGENWNAVLDTANGTVSARLGQGAIEGVDLNAFLKRVAEGKFFSLSAAAGGSIQIESAELKASISGGVAKVEQAQAVTANDVIELAGIVPYLGRSLALSGAVRPKTVDGKSEISVQPVQFFVGGSWSAPFISPVLSGWLPE